MCSTYTGPWGNVHVHTCTCMYVCMYVCTRAHTWSFTCTCVCTWHVPALYVGTVGTHDIHVNNFWVNIILMLYKFTKLRGNKISYVHVCTFMYTHSEHVCR